MRRVKEAFLEGLTAGPLQDLAFVGNSGDVYQWEPSLIIDLDVCLFVHAIERPVGTWLQELRLRLFDEMARAGIDFDLKVIKGSYKQTSVNLSRPIFVAHLSLFTEELYSRGAPLMRWGWRKYSCVLDKGRLSRLAPAEKPDIVELLHGRSGVMQKIASIESGRSPLVELRLPDLAQVEWTACRGEPLFAEYCMAAGAICSRNHARVLGFAEPDQLGNREFVAWYDRTVLKSLPFRELMALKERVRVSGYGEALHLAPKLAREYLVDVAKRIAAKPAESGEI